VFLHVVKTPESNLWRYKYLLIKYLATAVNIRK